MALSKRTQLVKELIIEERGIKRRNDAPFPQANSVDKLLKVIELAKKGINTKKDFQEKMTDVHKRQVDYYLNAAVYLGILKDRGNKYLLSKRFYKEDSSIALLESMLQNHIIREVVTLYYITRKMPSEIEIAKLLTKYGSYLENSTLTRRINTVQKWTKWILNKK